MRKYLQKVVERERETALILHTCIIVVHKRKKQVACLAKPSLEYKYQKMCSFFACTRLVTMMKEWLYRFPVYIRIYVYADIYVCKLKYTILCILPVFVYDLPFSKLADLSHSMRDRKRIFA